jgi:hypothetical protein
MKRFLPILVVLLALSAPLAAQRFPYAYTKTSVLNAATEVITVQMPADSPPLRAFAFKGISVYCSAECSFTLERDGTPATATAGTMLGLNRTTPAPVVKVYYSSDVGAGTSIGAYTVPAGGTLPIDLSSKRLTNPNENLTVRIASVTATVKVNVVGEEN